MIPSSYNHITKDSWLAHIIRHHATRQFKSTCLLSAQNRWCLTGTPIQNRLEDLGSLFQFLRIQPFNTPADFRKYIVHPMSAGNTRGLDNLRAVLESMCLRRTRHILPLPQFMNNDEEIDLSIDEAKIYQSIQAEANRAFHKAINSNSTVGLLSSFLQLILQSRLLCNHGTLVHRDAVDAIPDADSASGSAFDTLRCIGEAICIICGNAIDILHHDEGGIAGVLKACSHLVCQKCDQEEMPSIGAKRGRIEEQMCKKCSIPSERKALHNNLTAPVSNVSSTANGNRSSLGYSTKISKVISAIKNMPPFSKAIVFSCWCRTLDLIESALSANSIKLVRIDGTVSSLDRHNLIERFASTTNISVMLMTMGTGSVGLSIPTANRVFIVEPQWNPAVEKQAIGRVLRIGQERQVWVTRYIMKDTIEDHIRNRQKSKLKVADLTLEANRSSGSGLAGYDLRTLMELKSLF
jgi:SWI/SNF-related matrix-associated actin-dependent regulator of chromatin subfamily A3